MDFYPNSKRSHARNPKTSSREFEKAFQSSFPSENAALLEIPLNYGKSVWFDLVHLGNNTLVLKQDSKYPELLQALKLYLSENIFSNDFKYLQYIAGREAVLKEHTQKYPGARALFDQSKQKDSQVLLNHTKNSQTHPDEAFYRNLNKAKGFDAPMKGRDSELGDDMDFNSRHRLLEKTLSVIDKILDHDGGSLLGGLDSRPVEKIPKGFDGNLSFRTVNMEKDLADLYGQANDHALQQKPQPGLEGKNTRSSKAPNGRSSTPRNMNKVRSEALFNEDRQTLGKSSSAVHGRPMNHSKSSVQFSPPRRPVYEPNERRGLGLFGRERSFADSIQSGIQSIRDSIGNDSLSSRKNLPVFPGKTDLTFQNKSLSRINRQLRDEGYSDEKEILQKMKSEIQEIKSQIPLQTDSETQNEIFRENAIENYYKDSIKKFSVEDATNTRYLFTSDFNGNIKQFTIKHSTKYIKSHGKVHNGPIHCMISTYNSKYIFTGDWDGTLKQFTLSNHSQLDLVYRYGEVHRRTINSMAVTPDSQYLFTSSTCGSVKQFDIENRILVQDYGQVHDNIIYSIDLTMNGKWLFTSDKKGQVFQWVLVPNQPRYDNQINLSRKRAKNSHHSRTGTEESTAPKNSKKLKLVEVYKNSYPGSINSVRCSKDSKF